MIDKSLRMKPAIQGGGPNYLGKQKMVTAPKKWLSSPDHEPAELAYITEKEKDILIDLDLYGSLNGKPNRGPAGIMSLQGDMGSIGGGGSTGGGGAGYGGGPPNRSFVSSPPPTKSRAPTPTPTPTYDDYNADRFSTSKTPTRDDGPGNIHLDTGKEEEPYEMVGGVKVPLSLRGVKGVDPREDPERYFENIPLIDKVMSKDEKDYTIEDKRIIEEYEKTIDYNKVKELADRGESFQDIQKAIDKGLLMKQDVMRRQGLIDRGLAMLKPETKLESSLMGALQKTFNPKRMATNFALKKMGLSWLNPVAGLASLFFPKQTAAVKSKFSRKPKDMSAFSDLGLYANRQPTSTNQFANRVGDRRTTSQKIATGEVDLNKLITGNNLSKIKDYRADLSANDIKLINKGKKYGLTTPTEIRETVGPGFNQEKPPTDAEIKGVLEKTITKPTGIFAAHGGRIDKPFTGRSRDI